MGNTFRTLWCAGERLLGKEALINWCNSCSIIFWELCSAPLQALNLEVVPVIGRNQEVNLTAIILPKNPNLTVFYWWIGNNLQVHDWFWLRLFSNNKGWVSPFPLIEILPCCMTSFRPSFIPNSQLYLMASSV